MTLQVTPLNNVGVEVGGFDINAPLPKRWKQS